MHRGRSPMCGQGSPSTSGGEGSLPRPTAFDHHYASEIQIALAIALITSVIVGCGRINPTASGAGVLIGAVVFVRTALITVERDCRLRVAGDKKIIW